MFFRQILHDDLGCASYLIASDGEGAIVDPKWDIAEYLRLADEHGFEIRYVLETHNHADHVSGRGRLAAATRARIYTSPTPGLHYPHETLADGAAIEFGSVRIEAMATPGHRPEHTAYLVFDSERGGGPFAVLTGDSLFVGDVARPDLAVEAHEGAAELFASLARLLELPDHVQVLPGHIGGSLCGGASMSEAPGSTIGYERRVNPMLAITDRSRFVEAATEGLAQQPPNFRRIVELNQGPLLDRAAALPKLAPDEVAAILDGGGTLIDGRAPKAWMSEHVPGSVSVTIVHATVGSRAAAAVDPRSPVVVTAQTEAEAEEVARRLEAVGFRDLRGILAGGVSRWHQGGRATASTESIVSRELAARLASGELSLLDVRDDDEWGAGHVSGSLHVPLLALAAQLESIRAGVGDAPLAVACSAGNRAAVAVSLLERAGITRVVHAADGVDELSRYGIELTEPVVVVGR
jgi:glyoxylase-like metal-dependent hydrolase (beta-lactamase superfamily II)/rhodanese-related sulfurtransferase